MKSKYENKTNKQGIICKTISLVNPNKKSLTRNNSNIFITHNISRNKDKEREKNNNNIFKLDKKAMHRNKENDLNLLNKNLTNTYNNEDNSFIYYNRVKKFNLKNQDLIRTNSNNNFNLVKSNNNIYSPYYNSFKMLQNSKYVNELSNNIKKSTKQRKINCKTNNNSQNKISDYITPLKKKYFYYYH